MRSQSRPFAFVSNEEPGRVNLSNRSRLHYAAYCKHTLPVCLHYTVGNSLGSGSANTAAAPIWLTRSRTACFALPARSSSTSNALAAMTAKDPSVAFPPNLVVRLATRKVPAQSSEPSNTRAWTSLECLHVFWPRERILRTMGKIELQRELGLFDSISIVLGIVIGSGIFLVPNLIARAIGSPAWILAVWIVTGVLSFFGALAFAELGAMLPATGGQYSNTRM